MRRAYLANLLKLALSNKNKYMCENIDDKTHNAHALVEPRRSAVGHDYPIERRRPEVKSGAAC
jgi:hypothetical protein